MPPAPPTGLGRALSALAFTGSSAGALGLIVLALGSGEGSRDLAGGLLLLGAVLFAPYCLWTYAQPPRPDAEAWAPSPRQEALGGLAVILAMAGGGVECLAPPGPWLLLCVPAIVVLVLLARHVDRHGPGERSERRTLAASCLLFAAGGLALVAFELI